MPFAKSESNHDLLKLPDHSSARMITEFTLSDNKNTNTNTNTNTNKNNENGMFNVDMGLPSIGGGLIVVNNYGDYPISVGSLTLGQLGSTWKDKETAIDALCDEVDSTSEKCTATDLQIGGCGVLLYLLPNQQDTLEARQRLLKALGNEITNLVNTNVLCIPGPGIHQDDITFLHKTNSKVQVQVDHHHHHGNANANANANGDSDEEKKEGTAVAAAAAAASPSSTKGRRSRSLSIASEDFDYPIPLDLVTNPTILTDHAAHSAMGAVLALAKDKKWQTCHILLVGLTPISITMYRLLIERGYEVYMSVNPNTTDTTSSSIIPDDVTKLVPWEEAQRYRCDIMIPCTAEFPKLDPQFIEQNLRCHNIVSINHNLLPQNFKLREDTHVMLEEHGIFDFCDGLLDLGAIAKLYHLSQKTTFTSKDAMAMGSRMMGKSLHLAKIVQQYDVEEKHNFYKIVLNRMDDESTRSDSLNLGLGTMIHNSSSRMTEWMWSKAKVMCPAYRALQSITVKRNMKKDVYYLDLGSGTGAAARSICSQDSHIHFKCINICPKQNAENRQLSDEAGLGGQVSVDTVTFERLPSEYSNAFDGCIAQDSFFHAFSKLKAFSEAYKVTKGGGWIMVSDLMCGEGEHVSDDELKSFAEKNNIKSWVSCCFHV
jgi:SAM-dependent methyltransferase